MGLLLISLMILSIVGYSISSISSENSGEDYVIISGLKFYDAGGLWVFVAGDSEFYFSNLPNETTVLEPGRVAGPKAVCSFFPLCDKVVRLLRRQWFGLSLGLLLDSRQSPTTLPQKGGCPILNAAVDSDNSDLPIRSSVLQALDNWLDSVSRIVNSGKRKGEIQAHVDADDFASQFVSSIEGGIMLSKVTGDPAHLERVVNHLIDLVNKELRE